MTGWKHDDRTGQFEMQFESGDSMNGARAIFSSRRFWTMLLSIIVGLVLYFVGKYFAAALPDVQFVINLIVPLAIVLIAAFTVDDAIEQIMTTQREMHEASLAHQLQAARITQVQFTQHTG